MERQKLGNVPPQGYLAGYGALFQWLIQPDIAAESTAQTSTETIEDMQLDQRVRQSGEW